MSIELQCEQCGRSYRVGDEHAGKRVRCKACQAPMIIPIPAPAVMPPPLPRIPPTAAYPVSAAQWPPPMASTIAPPANRSNRRLIIVLACCFGGLLLLSGLIFVAASIYRRLGSSGAFLSDSQIQAKLVGDWTGAPRTRDGSLVLALISFHPDGTLHYNVRVNNKLADVSGTYSIQNHIIIHTITGVAFGKQSMIGTTQRLGYVKEISDTKLVLRTDIGEEVYRRVTTPAQNAAGAVTSHSPTAVAPFLANPGRLLALSNPGPWSDLLGGLDSEANTLAGTWTLERGLLTGSNAGQNAPARLALAPAPQGNYEVEVTFNRRSGSKEFGLIFPVGNHPTQLQIGGMSGQYSAIGNVTSIQSTGAIVNNTDQTLHLIVTGDDNNAAISVTLDGKPYLSWHGATRRLRPSAASAMADPREIGLFVHYLSTVQFKNVRVRAEQGTAR